MPKSVTTADNTTDENSADHLVMAGADVLLKALEDEGVEVVFGYPGGAVLPIYDALFKNNNINRVLQSDLYRYFISNDYHFVNWSHADLIFVHRDFKD